MSSSTSDVAKDVRGVPLAVGQWATIVDCRATLTFLRLDDARSRMFGRRFQITKLNRRAQDDGWWVSGDNSQLGVYNAWPTECVFADSEGLKGLVKRYRELITI